MSDVHYIGYYFKVSPIDPGVEILIAELGNAGFESFVETEGGLEAYIQELEWDEGILNDIFILKSNDFEISYTSKKIKQVNWNQEWEKNFKPILVDNTCSVRAPFHEKPNTLYDIIIEPKMSFGTGHHETTHMMIQHLLNEDLKEKKVLDMGCGTGILAILSEMRGAKEIDAIDIDNWCYLNTVENIERNRCQRIKPYEGDVALIKKKSYDIIIANINRNILVKDIKEYAATLTSGGRLFLSGFYTEDKELIDKECFKYHLIYDKELVKNNWNSVVYILK